MTDFTAGDPPALPVQALADALRRADLEAAIALVEAHDRAVRQCLPPEEAALLDPRQRQAWLNLWQEQQAVLAELEKRRDHVAGLIRQLQRHQRGAGAYLQAME